MLDKNTGKQIFYMYSWTFSKENLYGGMKY